MAQLVMRAKIKADNVVQLPEGYTFEIFKRSEKDIADWKKIIMTSPAPFDGADSCYHNMIELCHDIDMDKDIHFVVDAHGERVATITLITQSDGMGYVHMVKAMDSERGKGLGHAMANFAIAVFRERGLEDAILTTDDWRLSAIKTYLDAGFLPVIYETPEQDMEKRWNEVLQKLQYGPVTYIIEQ